MNYLVLGKLSIRTIKEILDRFPTLKIVLVDGDEVLKTLTLKDGVIVFHSKPSHMRDILKTIDELLKSPSS